MAAYKNLRWKTITIVVVVVAFAAVGVYPIVAQRYGLPAPSWLLAKQLKLGLDLKGGVHLVLRVNRDDALRTSTESVGEQLREALTTAGVTVGSINVTSPTTFRVEGVPQDRDAEFRRVAEELTATNYDRGSGVGGAYDFVMRPNIVRGLREQTMVQAHDTIDRRVNELGVTEPNIATHGDDGDQLLVQMPGVSDVARAKDIIGSPALLEIKLVEGGPAGSREDLVKAHGGQVPSDMEVVSGASDRSSPSDGATSYYLVRKVATVNGSDLRSASVGLDENSQPAVMFSLKPDGARKFGQVTGSNVGRYLAVVLDDRVQSYARIESRIGAEGRIAGGFTQQEAADLALKLRSGALPASMTYLEERVIGPTLGADSIRAGVTASLAGLVLVVVFMLAFYKLSGINAIVAMIVNLIILLGMMAYVDAAMTLPGIAGFILTMGMGVDSNVLIFERIKEELAANRGARASIAASFDRVFWTLFDTHVTSLIAAAFLFQFGTGPIRGFATTLFVGLISNLFTSIFVSRTLFEFVLSRRPANAQTVSI
jgi:preprotein translocase subunit SecD